MLPSDFIILVVLGAFGIITILTILWITKNVNV